MVPFADSAQLPGVWLGFYVVFVYLIYGCSVFSVIELGRAPRAASIGPVPDVRILST